MYQHEVEARAIFCPSLGLCDESAPSEQAPQRHPNVEARASEPHPVVLDKWEDLLVGDRIGVPDDEELLAVLHKLCDVLTKEGEGRVGDHNIRLFQECDAIRTGNRRHRTCRLLLKLSWRPCFA